MEGIQVVVFTLNDEVCGVETNQVKEIVKYESITKMPEMPKFIDGVISLRGTVVPVVNLNKRFGLGDTEITKKTKIIINDIEGKLVGFIVNDVSEIIKIQAEDIENTPDLIKENQNSYLKNVGRRGEELISILDFSAILSDTEIKSLN
jgi:purine-binding chemotaxis protein CheW